MGIGKEAAEQLREQAEAKEQRFQAGRDRAALIAQNKEPNWKVLVAALQRDVAEFVENFPRAKAQGLRADELNSNNLTVSTLVQPLLKIEVIRDYGKTGVQITVTAQHGWQSSRMGGLHFQYTPDGFTDGTSAYMPEQLSAEIFDQVTKFFREEE